MALTYSDPTPLGSIAPDFSLKGVNERTYSLKDFLDSKALVIAFICNHCPYVKAIQQRINKLAQNYASKGVQLIGINSNDAVRYPADSFEAMKQETKTQGYVFPYLFDETQEVARAYGAVCTPEFYAYAQVNNQFILKYKGRFDDNWKEPDLVTRNELAEALNAILNHQDPSIDQKPAMGCSIKWKLT